MGDVVQYKLERMLPELDDLERLSIFTKAEIASIVKQRRKFEFRLKRPSPLKEDFVSYIEYEKSLDKLRRLRKRMGGKGERRKKTVSDYAGVRRVLEIYRAATMRFKGDLELWFGYLEFCRERKNGRMKTVLAEVIRFHPKVPGVWIYAAAWEFDQNLNVAAARALMQSGLRACPNSEDLWVEYLRMELTYINKLKARKVALGEDEGSLVRNLKKADDKQWREDNKELFMSLDEKREDDDVASILQDGETETGVDLFREQGLNILRAVYSGAVEALPSSFSLRTKFIEILEATELDHSEEMRREILTDMNRDFSKEPEYWDWLAKIEISNSDRSKDLAKEIVPPHLEKAIQVYEEAIKVVPSATMFSLYTKFLMEAIAPTDEAKQSTEIIDSSDHNNDLISRLLMVYEKAESMGCVTEDLACQHVTVYLQLQKLDEARKLAEKLCNGKLSDAVNLWVLRISIEMRCTTGMSNSVRKADLSSVFGLLKKVLTDMTVSKAESLWLMALKTFGKQKHYLDKLVEISLACLTRDGGSDDGFSLSSAIIELLLQNDGIQRARDTYKRYLALPRPGLVLYKNCIELEANLALSGDRTCLVEARKLYESALSTYKHDVSLWQNYYSMEIKMGTSETANSVYWRAKKQLKDKVVLLSAANL